MGLIEEEQISLFDDVEVIRNYGDGRDEMNLAEFPISTLYKSRDDSVKTLHFEDQITDKATGLEVTRKLTVTASDAYGLPCSYDDEVILGLIQLTKLQGFRDRRVYFTKRQLLEILGWNIGGRNAARIEESLKRWKGVNLDYNDAWRDKEVGDWASKGFSIIDEYFLRERQRNQKGKHSYIVWNDVVFRSMKAGNLKPLNFHLFKELNCPTAKRIFRFLDKRFYKKRALSFDLEDFAYQKIGIDKRYKAGAIKQKLKAGIMELEKAGFIKETEKRYYKSGGGWRICFEKGEPGQTILPMEINELSELEGKLIAIGVTETTATKLIDQYGESEVEKRLEVVEFLLVDKKTAPANPPGYLVKSLKDGYESPPGFKTAEEKSKDSAAATRGKMAATEKKKATQRDNIEKYLDLEYDRALAACIDNAFKSSDHRDELEKTFLETVVAGEQDLQSDYDRKGLKCLLISIRLRKFLEDEHGFGQDYTMDEFQKTEGYEIVEGEKECVLKHNGKRVNVPNNW